MSLKFSNSIPPRLQPLTAFFAILLTLVSSVAAFAQTDTATGKAPARGGSAPAATLPAPAPATPASPEPSPAPGAVTAASGPEVAFGPCPRLVPSLPVPGGLREAYAKHAIGMDYHAKAAAARKSGDYVTAAADEAQAKANFNAEIVALTNSLGTATYKNSPYAAVMLYRIAHINADLLHDRVSINSSMDNFKNLLSQFPNSTYPDHVAVEAEREVYGRMADEGNRKFEFPKGTHLHPYFILDFFVGLTGRGTYSYAMALLLISLVIRLGLTPLTLKQYRGMAEMQRLQPHIKEINKKFEKDPAEKNKRMMALYKEHNVNPLGGCLPTLLQLPIYWGMYQLVVLYQYNFTHGTFLWIGSKLAYAFGALPFGLVVAHNLGEADSLLLILYCVSMYITQRMMPASDPQQAEVQKTTALMTSIFFFYIFTNYHFASAFVLYWLISNILSTMTQMYFMRKGLHPAAGVKPSLPSEGDKSIDDNHSNGNGKLATSNGAAFLEAAAGSDVKRYSAKPGTAKGTIAPKIHPKKKRR